MRQYRKIPAITGKQLIKLFKKDGWQIKNKKGDHISMFKEFSRVYLENLNKYKRNNR